MKAAMQICCGEYSRRLVDSVASIFNVRGPTPNVKVSGRSQPPATYDLSLSEPAGSSSLDALVGQSKSGWSFRLTFSPSPADSRLLYQTRCDSSFVLSARP